jgi:uncharacterized protein DUF4345
MNFSSRFEKKLLQTVVAVGGFVPVGAGLAGVLMGPLMLGDVPGLGTAFDSHYRYLSGLLLGIGLGFWSTVPHIEKKSARFQLLTAIVFIGGLSRFWSLVTIGIPDHGMLFGLAMELGVTPLLALWQYRISKG